MKSSVIIPAYNEEDGIAETVKKVADATRKIGSEVIVVDDGSKDGTYEIAKKIHGIKLVRHEENAGKAAALVTGFNSASGEILVTIDADCTYPPEEIPKIVGLVEIGKADMVICSRFMNGRTKIRLLNYYGNIFFSWLVTALTGKKITDASSGMRAVRKDVWKKTKVMSRGLDWEVEMTTRVIRQGYAVTEVPIKYFDRVGASKLNPFADGYRFLRAIIRGRFF